MAKCWILIFTIIYCQSTLAGSSFFAVSDLKQHLMGKKITLIASDIEITRTISKASKDTKKDWTLKAQRHVQNVIEQLLNTPSYVDKLQPSLINRDLIELIAHQRLVEKSILSNFRLPLPTKNDFNWSIGSQSRLIKGVVNADLGLFVFIRAGYKTKKSSADYQSGIASLVNLDTGRTLWFNAQANLPGDVRHPDQSVQTLITLFERFPSVSQR